MGQTDRIIHWVLDNLELETTVFHVGQYCGSWRASISGRARAGYHVVLHGDCWLHLPGGAGPVRLHAGDAVFFLRDVPHHLGPAQHADACLPGAAMQSLGDAQPGATGLACGFFEFRSGMAQTLLGPFPDFVVLPADAASGNAANRLFDLIHAEASMAGTAPSPLLARLVELLFFYVIRDVAMRDDVARGLWPMLRSAEFSPLVLALIAHPERTWSLDEMASQVHMSRATFCKRFAAACGQSPAAFLLVLRMKIASRLLDERASIAQVAERVGYRSEAAFAKAFKKATGIQPGAWRRRAEASAHRS
jgi:AraC-like DNA-binding protein